MRRVFASNLLLLLAINALVKPLYLLGIDLGVQNTVGTISYGTYATWFSFAFLFGAIYDLGLQNYNSVTLSKSPELLRERLPVMLSLKLGLSLIYAAVVLLAAYWFSATAAEMKLVGLAVFYHASLSILQLLRTNLGAQGKYQFNSWVSIVDRLLLIVLVGALLLNPAWTPLLSIELFLVLQIASVFLAIIVAMYGTDLAPKQSWLSTNMKGLGVLLKASLPYGLTLLLSTVFTRVDIVMLRQMAVQGAYEAGVYAASFRLLDGVVMVGFLFASLLLPMLSKLVSQKEPAGPLLQQASEYMLALGIGVSAFVVFYAGPILNALYVEATAAWAAVFSWLIWASIAIGLTYVYGSFLLSHQRVAALNKLFVVGVFFNVLLNALLIPRYGAKGAAIATVITQGAVAAGEWYLSHKILKQAKDQAPLKASFFVYLIGLLCFAYGLWYFQVNLALAFVLHASMCLALGLGSGFIDWPKASTFRKTE